MYLITGGAGFIGANIAKHLVAKGKRVRVLDDLSTGRLSNLESIINEIEFIKGDINDSPLLKECMHGVRYVLHQAALPSVPKSIANPIASNRAIVDGTLNVLIEARDAGIKRVVLASSSSVYGNNPTLPKREDMELAPLSPYAVAKYAVEMYARVFARLYHLETVSLRYFNVFGPLQDPSSEYAAVIPKFITRMLNGAEPVIFGDGKQSRDFTYVDNAVEANLLACHSPQVGEGEAINVACGECFSLNQLVQMLNNLLGTGIKPKYTEPRPGDIKHSLADITRAKRLLGYKGKVTMAEGLSKTIDYFKTKLKFITGSRELF